MSALKYPGYIWCAVVVFLLLGCRPDGVLPREKMVDVLCDLHRADAILQEEGYYNGSGHDEDLAKMYQVVMDKHGVSQAQFDSSLVWYTDHPQIFERIYPDVIKRLENEQKEWHRLYPSDPALSLPPRVMPPLDDVEDRWINGIPMEWPPVPVP